ncbi:MAG TPA: FMN-binding glutamate synthase family protein [Leadbetterella sp.]|nr:FMN-binding glutamate synthase family protein [Leadbetterella sp.]
MNFDFPWWSYVLVILFLIFLRDILQKKHTIQHNFPLVGHIRYFLESFGPELRQYIVANNREELPFNRQQRTWIYASSKIENNMQGFGTDQDIHEPGYVFIKPAMMPFRLDDKHPSFKKTSYCPSAKIVGPHRQKPYHPQSVVNISAMSYGSLSGAAITSLNLGAQMAGCFHNTGEGGFSSYHAKGGDVVLNIGTGYFGVRDEKGNFSLDKLQKLTSENSCIKMLELKLSQGAKPGKGGMLPGKKVTQEIADIRGVAVGKDVISPAYHTAFKDIPEMIDFIETMAQATGLPVGIKSAVGKLDMWETLAQKMVETGKGPNFITIDGGEGGTGAAPRAFADHVSLPWVYAFSSIYKIFQKYGLEKKVVFIGSGKLGLPEKAVMAFAMGVDMINVAREAMMSIGCIQAQKCHTNICPVGIATNNKWLESGLNPELKSVRFYNYLKTINKEILELSHACGYEHPSQFTMEDIEISMGDNNRTVPLSQAYGYQKTAVVFGGF